MYLVIILGIFYYFSHANIGCGYSSEVPPCGASYEYPQIMFFMDNWRKFFPKITFKYFSLTSPLETFVKFHKKKNKTLSRFLSRCFCPVLNFKREMTSWGIQSIPYAIHIMRIKMHRSLSASYYHWGSFLSLC